MTHPLAEKARKSAIGNDTTWSYDTSRILCEAAAELDRQADRIRALETAEAEMRERAAKIIDAERERVLSKQTIGAAHGSTANDRNIYLRTSAVLLPDVSAAIRALKAQQNSGEVAQKGSHQGEAGPDGDTGLSASPEAKERE